MDANDLNWASKIGTEKQDEYSQSTTTLRRAIGGYLNKRKSKIVKCSSGVGI